MTPILVPDLGDGISKVDVVAWIASEGAVVKQGDDLVELVTDKASFNVPAPVSGTLRKIFVLAGVEAAVGAILGEII